MVVVYHLYPLVDKLYRNKCFIFGKEKSLKVGEAVHAFQSYIVHFNDEL